MNGSNSSMAEKHYLAKLCSSLCTATACFCGSGKREKLVSLRCQVRRQPPAAVIISTEASEGCLFLFQDGKPVKKWVNMSQEFINQHTVEHKGKQICKYFLEGRCIKVIRPRVRLSAALWGGMREGAPCFFHFGGCTANSV